MKGGTRPRRETRNAISNISSRPEPRHERRAAAGLDQRRHERCHRRAPLAIRASAAARGINQYDRHDTGPPDRNVGQLARRLLFECGAGDLAREVRRHRRSDDLGSGTDPALQSGFRGRTAPGSGQGIAGGDRRGRRSRAVRARIQSQHPGRLEERARLGVAPGLHLGHGVQARRDDGDFALAR